MTWFKIKIPLSYSISEGSKFPPFYYGYAYADHYMPCFIFYLFPLNYFVRLWRVFRQIQNDLRMRKIETEMLKKEMARLKHDS